MNMLKSDLFDFEMGPRNVWKCGYVYNYLDNPVYLYKIHIYLSKRSLPKKVIRNFVNYQTVKANVCLSLSISLSFYLSLSLRA